MMKVGEVKMKRKVNVIEDLDGKKTVFIHDILFKGKRAMKWDEVEKYLRQYVGDICTIDDSNEVIYIGADLPDEYAHSNYTHILKGANAKAKANAAQGLPELIKIADGKKFTENYKVKGNYANRWKMLEDKKLSAVKEIFDEYGSEEVERFGSAVKNVHDVANKLGRFLKPNEMSSIIEKCFIGILSKEFTINCLISFVYTQGAEKLLETSLCHMKDEFTLEILSKIPFSLQLLDVINQVIDDDIAYWEKGAMPYGCCEDEAEELKIIVEKLIACKRYVTAVNIIGHSECEAVINAECIYKLMKLAGTEESIGGETLDDYAVQKIIGWFQQQEDIDLELRSDIEFIYLPMLDEYSEVRPRALNTRLSLEPEYFCSLIELFYKKRNGEKREIELNKSLSDRLCEILFQFKVTPGIDWNGNFDAKRFDYWMKTVKTWSRDNDRYEAAMHTVGLGLSYAELDEDKLPQTAVIEELNRVENDELRRGYYLGTINQRGAHWVDPEGKPELELAEDYENRANIAESRGYSRYAGILRVIADEFKREAKSNILEAKNGDDE